jgi:excisionase family DNA binding protein
MSVAATLPAHGLTPQGVADLLRVRRSKVLRWIRDGELVAYNLAASRLGRARWRIMPDSLSRFLAGRQASPPPKPVGRRRRRPVKDYYPD